MKISPPVYETLDKVHGRLERRQIQTTSLLNDYLDFPHVGQVCRITRIVTNVKTHKTTTEIVYGITSLSPNKADAAQLLNLNRCHWGIENRSHYVRDVTYDEDRSQIRTGQGPRVMATLRNFAISLLRLYGVCNIASKTRELAAKVHMTLRLLGL